MISFPFDNKSAVERDRAISSDIFAEYLKRIIGTNGIFAELGTKGQVLPKQTGLDVIVNPIDGFIEGRLFVENKPTELHLGEPADLPRIFTVAVRLSKVTRDIQLVSIAGTPARNPEPPALVREGGIYDLGIANIKVEAMGQNVTAPNITDTRINSEKCGLVPIFGSVDTTTLYNQIDEELTKFKTMYEADFLDWSNLKKEEFEGFMSSSLQTFQKFMQESGTTFNGFMQKSNTAFNNMISANQESFDTWFLTIQNKLDGDTAGKLANDIDLLTQRTTALETNVSNNTNSITQLNLKKGNIDGFERKNITVLSTSWVNDATFNDYPFKATIQVEGITDSHICTAFVPDHTNKLVDGIFSGWTNTNLDSLEIFASEKPADFNIELLRFEKVVI